VGSAVSASARRDDWSDSCCADAAPRSSAAISEGDPDGKRATG
jgi:hypothetical protein